MLETLINRYRFHMATPDITNVYYISIWDSKSKVQFKSRLDSKIALAHLWIHFSYKTTSFFCFYFVFFFSYNIVEESGKFYLYLILAVSPPVTESGLDQIDTSG